MSLRQLAELSRRGVRRLRPRRTAAVDYPIGRVLSAFAQSHPDAVFVQIGAHDTTQLDPLAPFVAQGWTGVMVEPQPAVFARLQERHGANPRLRLDQVAIAADGNPRTLYYLPQSDDPGLPPWYDALASFHKDVLLGHAEFIPDIAERMRTIDVPCLTFEALCEKHRLDRIDVVQIDTEGSDDEILSLIDLQRHRPRLVMFENLHLDEARHRACLERVDGHGYATASDHMDTVCLHRDELRGADRPLQAAWAAAQGTT